MLYIGTPGGSVPVMEDVDKMPIHKAAENGGGKGGHIHDLIHRTAETVAKKCGDGLSHIAIMAKYHDVNDAEEFCDMKFPSLEIGVVKV